jgi:hypothetical protein
LLVNCKKKKAKQTKKKIMEYQNKVMDISMKKDFLFQKEINIERKRTKKEQKLVIAAMSLTYIWECGRWSKYKTWLCTKLYIMIDQMK